ncbi:EcsC family protein [Bacillus sp. CGMCC 1.16541]|uniref:EcsC family protein n=1 Tax=Bacillus sp. CGMCC 1.16541 TaxID=2185143 RepID=UPI000D72581F|nr:EcsC family protein [Bacillus sp. CGMCC 1.16541]
MLQYEQKALDEAEHWQIKMIKRPSMFQRAAKNMQTKVNNKIPNQIHMMVTESIKKMIQTTIIGSNLTTKKREQLTISFEEKEKQVHKVIAQYKRTAALEGAGTGAGGLLLGAVDFPLLLSIKMKCLFDIASIYGYNIKNVEERVYILYIFHLAFCSDKHRDAIFHLLEKWDENKKDMKDVNWQTFQQEYRDYIDLVKMLQLIPGLGAVVGAYANYNLLDHLGEVAMNVYRLRLLKYEH